MSRTVCRLQAGACGGDSMSLLSAESPDLAEAFGFFDIDAYDACFVCTVHTVSRRKGVLRTTYGAVP